MHRGVDVCVDVADVVNVVVGEVVGVVLVVAVVVGVVDIKISHRIPVYQSGQMHRHPRYASSLSSASSPNAALPSSSSL